MDKLIGADGLPHFGILKGGVREINHWDYDLRNTMDRPRSRAARYWSYNRFHFLGLIGPELMVGCALVDLRLVSNAFIYFYQPKTKTLREYSFLQPLARKTEVSDQPDGGAWSFVKGRNRFRIEMEPGLRRLQVDLAGGDRLRAEIREPARFEPLAICTRAGYTGWVYTQKAAGLQVSGDLRLGGDDLDLGALLGSYDWSCGFMRRDTCWNWSCLSGHTRDGQVVGLNLAAGVNETGFTENGFWVDGVFHKVDTVDFQFSRLEPERTWRMVSADGKVDLTFEPEGSRREKLNLGLMASNFKQMFGRYHGVLHSASGEAFHLAGVPGFAEDHYARW